MKRKTIKLSKELHKIIMELPGSTVEDKLKRLLVDKVDKKVDKVDKVDIDYEKIKGIVEQALMDARRY